MEAIVNPFGVAIIGSIMIFSCGIVAIISDNRRSTAVRKAQEESRREVAAYVAEGSMTADEAERILNAGLTSPRKKA